MGTGTGMGNGGLAGDSTMGFGHLISVRDGQRG